MVEWLEARRLIMMQNFMGENSQRASYRAQNISVHFFKLRIETKDGGRISV